MSSRRQRERIREARMAFDRRVEETRRKNAEALKGDLKEEKPKATKSSTAKKKTTTTKKRASQKASKE